jgi:hypothetical protein
MQEISMDKSAGYEPIVLSMLANTGGPKNQIINHLGAVKPSDGNDASQHNDREGYARHGFYFKDRSKTKASSPVVVFFIF